MDIEFLLWLQALRQSSGMHWEQAAKLISNLIYCPLWVAGFILVYWRIDKRSGLWLLLSAVSVDLARAILKLIFAVPRPFVLDSRLQPVIKPQNFSFPSGHALWSVAEYGGWAMYLRKRFPWLVYLAGMLMLLTGLSRTVLGVHTPQDILAGFIIGSLILVGTYKLVVWLQEHTGWDGLLVLAGTALCLVLGWYVSMKSYPVDMETGKLLLHPKNGIAEAWGTIGFMVGLLWSWYIDRKWLKFSCPLSCGWKEWLWGLVGLVFCSGYALYAIVILPLLLERAQGRFAAGLTIALLVLVGYPWFLKRFKL